MRALRLVLQLIAAALAVVAGLSVTMHGLQLRLGPVLISATDPSRVALQASFVWLVAAFLSPRVRQRPSVLIGSLAAVLITAAADSTPRRVGDGAEYLAMAMNLSRLHPPALSADERRDLVKRFETIPGFAVATLDQPLVGADGRQDFPHFWLFSLFVAPLVAMVDGVGAHPNHAFTIFNGALLLALSWWFIVKEQRVTAAALLVAGPLIWWSDKAHAEVFLFVMMTTAVMLADRLPAVALLAASLAAAQNSGAIVVLGGVAAFVLATRPRDRATLLALGAAVLIAALPPAYYSWHLGTWSPLAGTVERGVPGLRAVLTTLIDLNLGLIPYAPVLVVLAVIGATEHPRRVHVFVGLLLVALLVVLSRPLNLNHGGSPGISRYALWLLACLMPSAAAGAWRIEQRRPLIMALAMMLVVAMSWYSFRPEAVDRGGGTPSMGATAIWTRWPALENPLPEVFAERVSGVDGEPPVPIALTGCGKALIRGDGTNTWWPFPCEPRRAPEECTSLNALCYVNGDRFVRAPRQSSFRFDPAEELSWTVDNRGRLPALLPKLGRDPRFVRLGAVRRTDGGESVLPPVIVEGSAGTAVWVRPLAPASFLRVRVTTRSVIEVQHAASGSVESTATVPAGDHVVPLPFEHRMLVLITDAS